MYNNMKGQTLIELLLPIGIMAVILPALLFGLMSTRTGKVQQQQRLRAIALLKQTQEAVRNVREKGWVAFAVNGTYYPSITGTTWSLVSGTDTIDGFT